MKRILVLVFALSLSACHSAPYLDEWDDPVEPTFEIEVTTEGRNPRLHFSSGNVTQVRVRIEKSNGDRLPCRVFFYKGVYCASVPNEAQKGDKFIVTLLNLGRVYGCFKKYTFSFTGKRLVLIGIQGYTKDVNT